MNHRFPYLVLPCCSVNLQSATGRQWDETAKAPHFDYREGDQTYQVWYDDTESLAIKYQVSIDCTDRTSDQLTFVDCHPDGAGRCGLLDSKFFGLLQCQHGQ